MQKETGISKRCYRIDNIRACAILLVVFGHSIIIYSSSWNLYSSVVAVPVLDAVKQLINIAQMPLFFSVAGYLFVGTMRRKTFVQILSDKARRLLVPYLFFSFCWLLPVRLIVGYKGYQIPLAQVVLRCIILGRDNGHLWFLITLFECFVLRCLIKCLCDKIRSYPTESAHEDLSRSVSLIVAVLLLVCKVFSAPFLGGSICNYSWFMLGELICSEGRLIARVRRSPFLGFLIACVACFTAVLSLHTAGIRNQVFSLFASASIVLMAFIRMPDKHYKILSYLAGVSFGVYLIHSPLVYITYAFMPNANPLLVVFVNFFVYGSLACLATQMIKRSNARFVIGE